MSKYTLLSVMGKIPQVTTEALWYFYHHKDIVFDRLVIVTTEVGEEMAFKGEPGGRFPKLLGKDGMIETLCQEYGIPMPKPEMVVFTDNQARKMKDVKTSEEFEAAAYSILDAIRKQPLGVEDQLSCIFSGGRRLMASYLMSALTLVGKDNHHLFYISVSPQDIDSQRSFFFPPKIPQVLNLPSGTIRSDKISIEAVEVLFPRLGVKYGDIISNDHTYRAIVNHVQRFLDVEKKPLIILRQPGKTEPVIVGESSKLKEALAKLKTFATAGLGPILIFGESGTGKELFAEFYGYWYSVSHGGNVKYHTINMGGIPSLMAQSELFGYYRGAFTGAETDKPGSLELAEDGVAFLDEINSLPLEIQPILLRFLQTGEIQKLGMPPKGQQKNKILNVKIVLATNEKPETLLREKRMRSDFLNRLKSGYIIIPPLRERREDIPMLVNFYVDKICREQGRPLMTVSDEAMAQIRDAELQGNVRDIEAQVEEAIMLAPEGKTINAFPKRSSWNSESDPMASTEAFETMLTMIVGSDNYRSLGLDQRVDAFEKWMLRIEFERSGKNAAKLAIQLHTPESTIKDHLKKLGIT